MSGKGNTIAAGQQAAAQPVAHDDFEKRYQARIAQLEKESGGPLSSYSKFLLHQAMWDAVNCGTTSEKER